ncbi:MAG: hypothetical protein HQL16_08325 [Candidatus Omnitrophica bacterium]|nr:hypothetical protein [Candidatus Omnitrophota bacterium]
MKTVWARYGGWAVFFALFASLAVLHFAGRINLTTADVGRHLKNGELFLKHHQVLFTNFYSYTSPDFPAICHHWLSGVFFYWIFERIGFGGLGLFYVGLLLATFFLFIAASARASRLSWAVLAGVIALPLAAYRLEIRPEGISTFFLAVYFFLLNEYRLKRLDSRWLFAIPVLQMLWVNAHIFFFIGFFLTVCFAWDAFLNEGASGRFKALFFVALATAAASFVNPFIFSGATLPVNIFQSYGYDLAENQNIFFMIKRFPGEKVYYYFLAVLALGAAALFFQSLAQKSWRKMLLPFLMYLFFSLVAINTVRAIAMFAFFFILSFGESGYGALKAWVPGLKEKVSLWIGRVCVFTVCLGLVCPYFYLSPLKKFFTFIPAGKAQLKGSYFYVLSHPGIWTGLLPEVNSSAEFWKKTGMKGPLAL